MNEVVKYLNSLKFEYNENVAVAVSGGPDSMCLLNLLINLRDNRKINVVCAHVNHSKRIQSNEEAIYVEKYCNKNNVIFEYLKIENYDDNINFHEQARNIRYDFFDKLVNKYRAKYLFLAHHGDDLIETILMKITRGSSVCGYSGFSVIQKRDNYNIVRPLIYVTKDDITEYLTKKDIKYYIDASNFKDVYTRNRYRKNILPFLKSENKNIHKKYIEFSEQLRVQEQFIQNIVNQKYIQLVVNDTLKVDKFLKEDNLIQKRILNEMLSSIYGDNIKLINNNHVKLLLNLIYSNKPNLSLNLPNNYIAFKEYNEFYIKENTSVDNKFNYLLINEVETDKFIIKMVKNDNDTSNYTIRLNSNEIKLPLYIRNRKNGDFIEVKGLNGTKKIKDILIDSKISSQKREKLPILVDKNGKILCIFGVKKSKYDKQTDEFYDIIVKCIKKKEENYEK